MVGYIIRDGLDAAIKTKQFPVLKLLITLNSQHCVSGRYILSIFVKVLRQTHDCLPCYDLTLS